MTSRASRAARTLLVPLALALTGCSGAATGPGTSDASTTSHHGHPEERALVDERHYTDALLGPEDLPRGYASGPAHGAVPTGDEPTPADCRPLAQLLRPSHGSDHGGHGGHGSAATHGGHEAATVLFTRSHVGPTVLQTVVDVGDTARAAAEVRRVEEAATRCRVHVQSTSTQGANTYSVAPLEAQDDAPRGVYLRLTATDADVGAEAVHWDLWVHHCAGVLVAVTFRSVPGGDDADFWAVLPAAADRLRGPRSGAC